MTQNKNILLIEDDKTLGEGIVAALKMPGLNIEWVMFLRQINPDRFPDLDLMILDINLPDGNGLHYLKAIRNQVSFPIILLTVNDMETDIVMGLEAGADDYITKPFSLAVLRARVNTQLRRRTLQDQNCYCQGEFLFDFDAMEYFRKGEALDLSKTEQKLLRLLVLNAGQTLSREQLIDRIWTDGAQYVDENALAVTVKRLRDKIGEDSSRPEYLKNVYGIGYTWVSDGLRHGGLD